MTQHEEPGDERGGGGGGVGGCNAHPNVKTTSMSSCPFLGL